jgi:hypothetical protein
MKAILIWIIVSTPLLWGVTQSVKKSMPLFGVEAVVKK